MSIIKDFGTATTGNLLELTYDKNKNPEGDRSEWQPTDEEKKARAVDLQRFVLGYVTMYTPRVEFSDLSTLSRQQVDTMAFNVYQPNNGDSNPGDNVNGWRSNAIRPVERNKAISIAAHATARLIFPKIFAEDENSDPQEAAAHVLKDLMEWSGEQSGYAWTALMAVIQAMIEPASIVHTEYCESYRTVKGDKKADGSYETRNVLDETLSGFRDTIVPTDALYIENFFEPDIQKQGWLVWRRVQGHALMEAKYGHLPNFKYVRPGMQLLYSDANAAFYWVYDPNMRAYDDEEVIVYDKQNDLQRHYVNGILLTAADNPLQREDKLYPFAKFGYEFIRASQCFYYKSLVFKVSHDANIINTIYPMIIDGTYLNLMPPMMNSGGEIITSDVIVPGRVTTMSSPDSQLTPLKIATDLKSGMETLMKVEESVNQSSEIPPVNATQPNVTAYQVAQAEQQRNELLGLFIQMIAQFVRQYGELRLGDILQHLTVADADKITDEPGLVYKSFLVNAKEQGKKHRKIKFDQGMMDAKDALKESYKTLEEQGGAESDVELYRVNPEAFRDLKYRVVVTPDVLAPRSEEVERMYRLEAYDRAIQNPTLDPQEVTKDFLLDAYAFSARDPEKYLAKGQGVPGMGQMPGLPQMNQGQQGQPQTPQPQANPMAQMAGAR